MMMMQMIISCDGTADDGDLVCDENEIAGDSGNYC